MIACVRIVNFALRLHVLGNPAADGEPMVLSVVDGERRIVLDLNPEAVANYLWVGMSIRDVHAMSPETIVVTTNPARESEVSERILCDLETLSPFVEADLHEAGCWYLDLEGLERLYGEPRSIAVQMLQKVPPLLRPRIGLAATKFGSYVATGRANAGGIEHAPDNLEAYLAGTPIESLPASPQHLRTLRQLGIDTLGALAALRPSAVAARFGPLGRTYWNLAKGIDSSVVSARRPLETIVERLKLDVATASRDAVQATIQLLVQRASSPARLRQRVARRVRVRLIYERGGSWQKHFTLRNPAAGNELARQLRNRLRDLLLPNAVAEVELELSELGHEAPRQAHLATLRGRDNRPVSEVEAHLNERYGRSSLHRVVPIEPWSRMPERRFALMPLEAGADDRPIALNLPRVIDVEVKPTRRPQAEPAVITLENQQRSVERIAARWFLNDEWWFEPVKRRYFTVELAGGVQQTVYHDLVDHRWYAQDARVSWP